MPVGNDKRRPIVYTVRVLTASRHVPLFRTREIHHETNEGTHNRISERSGLERI